VAISRRVIRNVRNPLRVSDPELSVRCGNLCLLIGRKHQEFGRERSWKKVALSDAETERVIARRTLRQTNGQSSLILDKGKGALLP